MNLEKGENNKLTNQIENKYRKGDQIMKTSTKIVIGATVAATVTLVTLGVIREIRKIKKITVDADDAMPEEILFEDEVVAAEEDATV